ncbi:hypothetical protein L1049_017711 [Liquidambar formosana]|uniref:Kinesin motor domain-containing protein n=1 Tax=Liquidambar formosana TaxID=63359 RepID=A0AAP0X4J2_LIQFO
MSRDTSATRNIGRSGSKPIQSEANENEFENSLNSIHFPPSRTPLNTIADPSQCHREFYESDFDSTKFEGTKSQRLSDKKAEALDNTLLSLNKAIGNVGLNYGTPRVSGRAGKAHSEPNSAQSTPARSFSKTLSVGAVGTCTGSRPPQYTGGGRGGSSSRVSRAISVVTSGQFVEVPHFELVEDPSFWMDHNVQVFIRIRPLSTMERVSQGYGRCLRQESAQTLVWLGHPETRYTFDHIACETISQEKLFRVAGVPMVENCMSGYNSCMFAYGQTGSGKTYTMMGEIYEVEGKLNEDCGITPRIFEYLFMRIRAEEDNRRDEQLKYSCKCSFLEIYNEQITDLLEPSSTNLQLREDLKKGVYVENLSEYNVRTVNDVSKLLLQGAANRKMAATHMNSESSRSHSVFTCIIESCWEKDSMTHFRFSRLNLVDLAGSERQKSSGAEGDRLKEAANINKSLSTLGLVIMSLVDLAHGKQRHVPYRDSRLTFLLQDSLGGNSKTTIIANVSPSICSANETLSTLKFAQRAKLIQNNAKVNEDASGDVSALQRQIQQLKGQLSFLMKHPKLSRSLSCYVPCSEVSRLDDYPEEHDSSGERTITDYHKMLSVRNKKMKCMEATLVAALRREKMAETAVQKLEAEIEHMNRLAHQREEDAQRTKMMLRFREEKIKRLELLADGSVSAEKYLMEENNALLEEIQLLQARIDRNPELTRFALENIRLIEQLRLFQNFYEQGERETLLAEVSELRDQLLETLEGQLKSSSSKENQDDGSIKELEDCQNMNSKLMREVDELRIELRKYMNSGQDVFNSVTDSLSKNPVEFIHADKYSLVESISVRSDSGDEMQSYNQADDEALQNNDNQKMGDAFIMQPSDTRKELMDARLLIEVMESEQVSLIEELQFMQEENHRYKEILSNKDKLERDSMLKLESPGQEISDLENQNKVLMTESSKDIPIMDLQANLDRITKDLEEARFMNSQYQEDQESQLSHQLQVELVCEQVEMETTKTILHLQEEVAALQKELQERLCCITQENMRLRNTIASKEDEMRELCSGWERATLELSSFLIDGSKSLKDASAQIESIAYSFPQVNVWIGEHIERAAKVCVEKEVTILLLQKSLEDAQNMVGEMELKLNSLKGATMALNEVQQQLENDESTKEAMQLSKLLNEKTNTIRVLESTLKYKEDHILEAEKRADAAFVMVKRLSDCHKVALRHDIEGDVDISKLSIQTEMGSHRISEMKAGAMEFSLEDIEVQVELARLGVLESENAINVSYADLEMYSTALQIDIREASSAYREFVQDLVEEIQEMRKNLMELKGNRKNFQFCAVVESLSLEPHNSPTLKNHYNMLHQIRDELAETNDRLNIVTDCINMIMNVCGCPVMAEAEDIVEADGWSTDCSTSGSDFSIVSVALKNKLDVSSSTCCPRWPEKRSDGKLNLKVGGVSILPSDSQEPEKLKMLLNNSIHGESTILCLRKELEMAFNAFNKLYVRLDTLFNEKEIGACYKTEGIGQVLPSLELNMEEAETGFHDTRLLVGDVQMKPSSSFLTKIEEAHTTIKEADFMLNALLKANENAKQLTLMWKKAGEELMVEKASLMEEVEQLKSSICLKEKENEKLLDQVHYGLVEIANLMSLLEGSSLQMQRDVEEWLKVIYSDVLSTGRDILNCICNSRSSLEDVCSEIMEKEFALFVLYQCHISESFHIPSFKMDPGFLPFRQPECHPVCLSTEEDDKSSGTRDIEEGNGSVVGTYLEEGELGLIHDNMIVENLSLKKELERKEVLLKGLLFDFSLLQESASNTKDIKDETEKLIVALSQVQCELEMKTSQLDSLLDQHKKLEGYLADGETALYISNSELEQAKEKIDMLSDQNADLRVLLKDLYIKKSEAEEQLEEQKEVVRGLEKEILRLPSTVEEKLLFSVEDIEDNLRRVTSERDQLNADENEALAVEAHQESEANKIYAEQKEEEVKILERSVEELECTINVMEKKVNEMDEEVERHRLIRDSLELELQALRQRMLTVENFTENMDLENINGEQTDDQISRQLHNRYLELQEAHDRIRFLEQERAEQDREIKQCKEYISELVLHAEAQASQYQQKYKNLEAMVREVKTDSLNSTSTAPTLDRAEKSSTRTRGSSSPFRCIASLVQQMNLEKDQELSMARLRIEELESLAASRQKEVCMLNSRLAAAESMTHDVIRDLLGVKLDMTNYANLIDQHQVQKLVEEAQQQTEESLAMEQEILNLRKQITDLIGERESCISILNKREADIFAAQMNVEQLQERDQLLTTQNEMLKMDKTNLKRKVAELDEMVKKLIGTQSTQQRIQQPTKIKENSSSRLGDADLTKRLAHSEKLLSRVNNELAQFRKIGGSHSHDKTDVHGLERKYRKHQA